MALRSLAYVSATHGVHDERWINALSLCAPTVHVVSFQASDTGGKELVSGVDEMGADAVLAGPLDSVARSLIHTKTPLVGLSWGYDLHALADAFDLDWVTSLDGLIVDTEVAARRAVAAGFPPDAITVLPWGVDVHSFHPEGPRATLPVPPDAWVVLSARAHEALYRVEDVLRSFIEFATSAPDAHLVVINEGSLTGPLKALAENSDVAERIHFLGKVAESDVPALLRASSCYVTMSEVDGTSVTLLQAMACGVPVIASRNAGNPEWIVHGETGTLVDVGAVDALAEALHQQYLEGDSALVSAARRLIEERADWHVNIARLCSAMEAAVHN